MRASFFSLLALGLFSSASVAVAQVERLPDEFLHHSRILGAASCSTSGCHGGASEQSRQFVIWSQRDVHSRSYATLTNARSARMAEALKIADPTQSPDCTSCHAPLQTVAPVLLAQDARIDDGVSCASCHGSGENWLRSHTRKDWTHADRVQAGMRDLKSLEGRANACVACHQNISPEIVKTGKHPALIFELDGQSLSEPKHWREADGFQGAQAWYVGQAVALREMSWALDRGVSDPALDAPRWAGLLWLLAQCDVGALRDGKDVNYAGVMNSAAAAARQVSAMAWTPDTTKTQLKKLAAAHDAFLDLKVGKIEQAYRAERLVLGIDRLIAALPAKEKPAEVNAAINVLFGLVQSIPDFSPADFARELARFEQTLKQVTAVAVDVNLRDNAILRQMSVAQLCLK